MIPAYARFVDRGETKGRNREHEGCGVRHLRTARDRGRSACVVCEHDNGQLDGDGEHGDRA
jgi:hypothetical protein